MPVIAVVAVGAIVWLVLEHGRTGTPAVPPTNVTQGGVVVPPPQSLGGQGTGGGTPGINPSSLVPSTGGKVMSPTAVRIAGAGVAAGGVFSWLQARSNTARTVSGSQTGAGVAMTIGGALGPATLGIGAGIGALVGFLGGLNRNDTKEARWDLVA